MSNQTTQGSQPQAVLPDPQTAANTLFSNVHARVFFGKLAAAGIAPRTEKEAQDLLELAGTLRQVAENPQVKQAQDQRSPFAVAHQALHGVLAQTGLDGGIKAAAAQQHDQALQQAVEMMAQDPTLYNSVLSLKAAEAAQLEEVLGQRA